mmetsp:Transcript_6916/g.13687  ORF Transcript_6916/g.13687 Transcript_6916/m.13687 type:complete len:170 (+) Transcript_6916:1377-1886(+)
MNGRKSGINDIALRDVSLRDCGVRNNEIDAMKQLSGLNSLNTHDVDLMASIKIDEKKKEKDGENKVPGGENPLAATGNFKILPLYSPEGDPYSVLTTPRFARTMSNTYVEERKKSKLEQFRELLLPDSGATKNTRDHFRRSAWVRIFAAPVPLTVLHYLFTTDARLKNL